MLILVSYVTQTAKKLMLRRLLLKGFFVSLRCSYLMISFYTLGLVPKVVSFRRYSGLELWKIEVSPIQKAALAAKAHSLGRKPEVGMQRDVNSCSAATQKPCFLAICIT